MNNLINHIHYAASALTLKTLLSFVRTDTRHLNNRLQMESNQVNVMNPSDSSMKIFFQSDSQSSYQHLAVKSWENATTCQAN